MVHPRDTGDCQLLPVDRDRSGGLQIGQGEVVVVVLHAGALRSWINPGAPHEERAALLRHLEVDFYLSQRRIIAEQRLDVHVLRWIRSRSSHGDICCECNCRRSGSGATDCHDRRLRIARPGSNEHDLLDTARAVELRQSDRAGAVTLECDRRCRGVAAAGICHLNTTELVCRIPEPGVPVLAYIGLRPRRR